MFAKKTFTQLDTGEGVEGRRGIIKKLTAHWCVEDTASKETRVHFLHLQKLL